MNKGAQYFKDFNERLMLAEEIIPLIGRFYRQKSVV